MNDISTEIENDEINVKNLINDRILNTHRVPLDYTIEEDDSLINKADSEIKNSGLICYDMSGFFSPIAIRDQVIRAYRIVKRAVHHKIISSERPLLIIGGGIAGMTAAIVAAEAGIRTVLVEKRAFRHNILKSNRNYCPVQYDWSYNHWKDGVFPLEDESEIPKLPFNLKEGAVHFSFNRVQQQFFKYINRKDLEKSLTLHEANKFADFSIIEKDGHKLPFLKAQFKQNDKIENLKELNCHHLPDVDEFGMGLSCIGFGDENISIKQSDFQSLRFWEFIQHPQFVKNNNKILVCGGGDGALQEFLMLVTQEKTAKEVFKKALQGVDAGLINDIENNIRKAEEDTRSYELWLNGRDKLDKNNLCKAYRNLHTNYENEVEKLLQESEISQNLKKLITENAYKDKITVTFLCNHFSACYPLNRFLAILIGKHIDEKRKDNGIDSVFKKYSSVIGITGTEENKHICDIENPNDCQINEHKVTFAMGFSCRDNIEKAEESESKEEDIFQTILIRYGILPPRAIFKQDPNYPGKQILPLTLLDLDD